MPTPDWFLQLLPELSAPQVGQLYVANLTLGQLEDLLYDRLGRVYSGVRRGPDAKTPPADVFNPFRVGLDHVALGCTDESELQRVASALAKTGVENTGVKLDETLGKRYVAFKDPDRIAWEFYMT